MFRRGLLTTTALFAPENDQGGSPADLDDNQDQGVDADQEEDLPLDPLDEDDQLDPPDDEFDDDPPPAREPSRAERAVTEARRRAQDAEAELARLRAESQSRTTAQAQRDEQERLAQLEPWERAEYVAQRTEQRLTGEIQRMRFESQDATDRTSFEAACSRIPAYAKVARDVEARLAELRANGTTASRETVAKYLIGENAVNAATRARPKAKRDAAEARTRETVRPGQGGARSDVARGTGKNLSEAEQRRQRLEDMKL